MLEVRGLTKHFPAGGSVGGWRAKGWVKAVDGIDFTIEAGQTLGLVGESGCGKTTTTKLLLLLERPTSGSITFDGQDVTQLKGKALLGYRRSVQAVFQDPYSSLSPRMRVGDIIGEPLEAHGGQSRQVIRDRVNEALELVGLNPNQARLFPHEFSGGQRQRIAIARVFLKDAPILVLDEATSALDSEVEAAIQENLFHLMKGKTVIAIAHRLSTIAQLDRLVVIDQGRIVEQGSHKELVASGGLYADLWARQSGGFIAGEPAASAAE